MVPAVLARFMEGYPHHGEGAAANHVGLALWGDSWRGKMVWYHCDNVAVVVIVNSGTSKCTSAMHDITLWEVHVPGVENQCADALSRNRHDFILFQNPAAIRGPTPIPPELQQALARIEHHRTGSMC